MTRFAGATVPPLGYGFDALEPYIDSSTMMIHHDRHHGALGWCEPVGSPTDGFYKKLNQSVQRVAFHTPQQKPCVSH
jgi:superoxide dismutase